MVGLCVCIFAGYGREKIEMASRRLLYIYLGLHTGDGEHAKNTQGGGHKISIMITHC